MFKYLLFFTFLFSGLASAQVKTPPTSLYQDAGRISELSKEVEVPPVTVSFDLQFPTRAQSRVVDIKRTNDRFDRPLWRDRVFGIYPSFQLREGDELAIFLDYAGSGDSIAFLWQDDTLRYVAPLYVYFNDGEFVIARLESSDVPTESAWRVPTLAEEAPVTVALLAEDPKAASNGYEIKGANIKQGQYFVEPPPSELSFDDYYDELIYRRATTNTKNQEKDSLRVTWGNNRKAFSLNKDFSTEENRRASHELILQIVLGESGLLVRPLDRQVSIGKTLLYDNYLDFPRIREVVNRLSYHTEMTDAQSEGYIYSFEAVRNKLLLNPFLGGEIAKADYLKQVGESSRYQYFDFKGLLQQAYPWHEILYGDSLLQLEKQLSFEDLATSYREPITSRKELTLASTAINANRSKGSLLDARTVAVGLSDFIAERAQEELNLTFFERFKANLDKPSELTILFPNTRDLLYQFQISNYKTLLSFAKTSFQTDLDNLGLNFPKVLDLDKYQELKNDPNVFNLSLIYSIADLAYKEYPIETIMLATNQKLRKRQRDLGEAINLRISKGALSSFPTEEIYRLDEMKPAFRNWQNFKDTLGEYLNLLLQQSKAAADLHRSGNEYAKVSEHATLVGNTAMKKKIDLISQQWTQQGSEFDLLSPQWTSYQGRNFYESRLGFAENVINENLNGSAYYDYIIDQPRLEDYDKYFGTEAEDAKANIAAGLQQVRKLLAEEAEAKLGTRTDQLLLGIRSARDIEAHLQLQKAQRNLAQSLVDSVKNCANLLEFAINAELDFWMINTRSGGRSPEFAGLRYLSAVLQRGYAENGGNDLQYNLERILDSSAAGTNDGKQEAGATGSLLPSRIERLYTFLDTIYGRLLDQRATLTQRFGRRRVNLDRFRNLQEVDRIRFVLNQIDGKIALAWQNHENVFQEAEGQKPDSSFFSNATYFLADSLWQEKRVVLDTALYTRDEEAVYYARLEYEAASYELKEARRAVLLENSPKLVAADEAYSAAVEKHERSFVKYEQLLDSVNSLIQMEQVADATIAEAMATNPFQNRYIEQYLRSRSQKITIDSTKLRPFQEAENKIKEFNTDLAKLTRLRLAVQRQLQGLEVDYSQDLVRARRNAQNLGRAVEMSTHLLFAFRDYGRSDEPLVMFDTLMMEMQEMVPDTVTGGTHVRTFEQMKISEMKIKPTTKQLNSARWLRSAQFDSLRNDSRRWNIFLGLLYQRLNSVEDSPSFSPQGIALLATKFFNIANEVDQTLVALRRKRAIDADAVGFRDYYPFIRSSVDLFNTVITTSVDGDKSIAMLDSTMAVIPKISNEALSLYENIFVKNYSEAVLNSMELLKIIAENGFNRKKDRRKALSKVNGILRYGTFMAKMIDAESSDQVKDILRSQALPPGSSREKRESVSNFAINSYLGGSVARDNLLGAPADFGETSSFGASLSVPVGFTYSFSPSFLNRSSFSLHIPLIDLGAITAYRQNPSSGEYDIDDLPEFTWENLLAPGAFAVYNLPRSPFSFGIGGQYGPQLREIVPNVVGAEAIQVNSWRFPMIFFNIDVPLFRLHAGPEKIVTGR